MAKKKSTGGEDTGVSNEGAAKPYVVLARKYRPQTFDDLIGQDALVKTLKNAFAAGRIAQGYMLTGVRGIGKTTTARILARALNYEAPGIDRPTIDMPVLGKHCAEIMEGRHPDVLEMDAASNTGVDNMREIIESAQYAPLLARTRVFIIDEVHMLSKSAFNALLKTLEEPPGHVKFIFATTEIRKVPVTVLSRCQRFDLRRVEQPVLCAHFKKIVANEGASADDDALGLIARAAEGSVRDGLSILDQAIAMGEGHVTAPSVRAMLGLADRWRIFDLAESLFKGDAAATLSGLKALYQDGAEPTQIICDLAEAVHIVARIKAVGAEPSGEGLSHEEKARGSALAERLSMAYLARAWQMLLKGIDETQRAPIPYAAAEMLLIRLAYTADLPTPDDLITRLGGGGSLTGHASAPKPEPRDERGPLNQGAAGIAAASTVPRSQDEGSPRREDAAEGEFSAGLGAEAETGEFTDLGEPLEDEPPAPLVQPAMLPDPRTFAQVVALAGGKRDMMLKVHLEDNVSLVKFDAATGSIDLHLLPGAPAELANDLREKLNMWTGRRWMVMLSKTAGAPAIGEVRRQREAAELAAIRSHPAVQALLDAFPQAKIADVRRTAAGASDGVAGDANDESQAI
ncbi:MAG TPA: DNA polymerase III subunit gamma/tau [Hyphomicrobium sp.]|nr:DNA polymerase III subunit gamma/tau [Hyphomicrobium sp.]